MTTNSNMAADAQTLTGLPGVSVLICTRNRAQALGKSLDAVARAVAAAPGLPAELVLVNNGSTDDTQAVAEAWAREQGFPVTLVTELRPGLARARNAGLARARHEIVAMTDDDCELHADYLVQVARLFARDPTPRIVGGRVELGDPEDLPITIKTDPEPRRYASGTRPGGFLLGANLVLHRAVVDALGPFDERFGAGAKFIAAEDTDYVLRADLAGFVVEYVPSFVVDHYHGRRDIADAVKLSRGYNFGDGALYAKHLLSSRAAPNLMKAAVTSAVREFLGRRSSHPILGEREHAFRLRHLTRGFAAYLLAGGR
jgi:glycosyltransferase involved in cell wall biosynthesis